MCSPRLQVRAARTKSRSGSPARKNHTRTMLKPWQGSRRTNRLDLPAIGYPRVGEDRLSDRGRFKQKGQQMVQRVETVIIGGGQAGLSISYFLTQQGRTHVILEQGTQVARAWRDARWDSFTLVIPNWSVRLPGFPYDGNNQDGFMTRSEIVGHLEQYAASFGRAAVLWGASHGSRSSAGWPWLSGVNGGWRRLRRGKRCRGDWLVPVPETYPALCSTASAHFPVALQPIS